MTDFEDYFLNFVKFPGSQKRHKPSLTTRPPSLLTPPPQAFQGRHGRAYLFNDVTNITLGGKEDRMLMTGLHTVRDVFCTPCGNLMGWKYETAYETGQKYKEGKFIVEKAMVLHEGGW